MSRINNNKHKLSMIEKEETFEEALDNLVLGGYVYAICDSCQIPLDKEERVKVSCCYCGPIKEIHYKLNDSPTC